MKKICISIFSLLLVTLVACQAKNDTSASEKDAAIAENAEVTESSDLASSQTEEGAKAFIETVYKTYLNPTAEDEKKLDDAEITIFGMAYMSQYMSDNLQEKIVEANDKQIADDTIFFEADIWTNSQDDTGFKVKEINNVEFTGETATLEVVLNNGHQDSKVYPIVEYNKDKGCWCVSDFLVSGEKFISMIDDYLNGKD